MASHHNLVVGNLPSDVSREELQTVFETYGELGDIDVKDVDPATGFAAALLSYKQRGSGYDAIQVLHNLYRLRADATDCVTVRWGPAAGSTLSSASTASTAGSAGAADDNGHKLFVGCLPMDVVEDELKEIFGTYGEVLRVVLMKPSPSSGLRAAFVFYAKKEAGEDAIKVLSGIYRIRADAIEPLQVKWGKDKEFQGGAESTPGYKLFVGNLPSDITEDELQTVFATYGEVNLVHLLNPTNQTGNKAALVLYAKREPAEDAINVLDGQYKIRQDMEQPLLVKWGKEKNQEKGWDQGGKGGWDSGKASWVADPWSSGWQSSKGGWDDGKGKGKGKGKLGWDGGKGKASWDAPKGKDWDSGKRVGWDAWGAWDEGWGGAAEWGKDSGWGGKDWKGGEKGGKGDGISPVKLFVANLPLDVEETALEYLFSTYGRVEKVHIMRETVRNNGIAALVEMGTQGNAETAIATLHDKYEIRSGQGPILVRHAHNKQQF